jgi:hypothetical protein
MKDYRAKLRAEAEARRVNPTDPASVLDALAAIGAAVFAPFLALADSFVAAAKALRGSREQMQDDFALVPGELRCGGAEEPTPRYLHHDMAPNGLLRLKNDTGRDEHVLTREEWDEIHRLAEERGEQQ